jgi:glycosyltransferase involved in cell wall biosynthesis
MSALGFARKQWRRLPLRLRRAVGAQVTRAVEPWLARELPSADPRFAAEGQDEALVFGLFGAALGHATAADLLRAELLEAGVGVERRDLTAASGAKPSADRPAVSDPPVGAEAAAVVLANPPTMIAAMAFGQGPSLRDRRCIGYWVWELEQAPARWAHAAHAVHEVWTPSAFSAAALAGVAHCPIRVVPHPCALAPPPTPTAQDRDAARKRFGFGPETFVALSSFTTTSSLARKNPWAALRGFEAAFGDDPEAVLVLRCLGAAQYPEAAAALRNAVHDCRARVLLLDQPGGLEELHALYAACDVYLSLHRSEGFGLNLAEAMLSRRPVIATAYSAPLEFMDAASAALIPARMVPVADPQGVYRLRGAHWAEPEHEAVVEALRLLRRDPDHRARLGAAGFSAAATRLRGGAAARALRQSEPAAAEGAA